MHSGHLKVNLNMTEFEGYYIIICDHKIGMRNLKLSMIYDKMGTSPIKQIFSLADGESRAEKCSVLTC